MLIKCDLPADRRRVRLLAQSGHHADVLRCLILTQSGHYGRANPCPLLGVKRTSGSQRRGYRLTISQPPGTHLKRVPESGRTDFVSTALTMIPIASPAAA